MTHRKPLLFATTVTLVTGVWFWLSSSQATSSVLAETETHVAAPHAKAISVESKAPNAATPTQNTNSDPQVVFAQALEDLAPPAPTADVKELAKTPQPDVENDTLEATTYTQVITSEPANFDGSGTNSKPRINAEVARQIQSQVFGWELDQGAPIHYSLNIDQLFVDADDDFLTLTVRINVPGLKVRNLGAV